MSQQPQTQGNEKALEKISVKLVSENIRDGDILGLGSGSTVAKFTRYLGQYVKEGTFEVKVVPSSTQAWLLAKENKLSLLPDSGHCPTEIDVTVDGADQIAVPTRSMIKGGGGALLREKIMLSSSKKSYILADSSKYVPELNRPVPVEVSPFSLLTIERKLKEELGAQPMLRTLDKGYPFFTESGNLIFDCQFDSPIADPAGIEAKIKMVPGVVEAGVFNCKVDKFYQANQDGTFEAH